MAATAIAPIMAKSVVPQPDHTEGRRLLIGKGVRHRLWGELRLVQYAVRIDRESSVLSGRIAG
jgi:hypothetical protein